MTTQQSSLETYKTYFKEIEKQAQEDYFSFLRYPSISSEASFKTQVLDCAHWLSDYLKKAGFDVQFWPTASHPVIFATHLKAGPDKPTLLLYHHYDVQPVDPVEDWVTPPFEPTVREGEVYARGAQDNKGQCFYSILALKTILEKTSKLPINVKVVIEGEEECGSEGLSSLMNEKKELLKADYLAIVDVGLPKANSPAVTLGVRGIVTMEVEVTGTTGDLHSGSHGGLAYNPIHTLVEILGKLRNSKGEITVPGFYDDVVKLTDDERKQISFEFNENEYEKMFGAKPTGGEKAYPPGERAWTRPTIEINGIHGGYTGDGFKTVIPAKAFAKVSCRLVPNQNPQKIANSVANFLEKSAPDGTKVRVKVFPGGGKAVRANPNSKIVQAFAKAYEEVFQAPCRFIFEGGSIPVSTELAEASQSEIVLVGLGLPDDQIHAPNEHFGLDRIEKGFLIIAKTLELLGE